MTKDLLAAGRYAKALFEISRDLHKDEEIEAELEALSEALKKSPELLRFVSNPSLKLDDKKKLLGQLYQDTAPKAGLTLSGEPKIHQILLNFFLLLFEKNRFFLIHDIAVEFKRIADEAQGQGVAEIRSAVALKPEAERTIVHRLEQIAGYKITVKKTVDPSLIGGVLIKVKNKIIDDTVFNKLNLFKKELTKIHSI